MDRVSFVSYSQTTNGLFLEGQHKDNNRMKKNPPHPSVETLHSSDDR